jgi:predicted DCC family thiol-disulfide oxidoreductase YuxK
VNTEITDKETAGWVFYDAECRLCARGVRHWGAVFARRGFVWLPLQTAGTSARLGVGEADLRDEMHLLLPSRAVRRGVDAWATMLCGVWWLWPIGLLLALPGVRGVARLFYRWLARNRHCANGVCGIPRPERKARHHGAVTFWEMP